jgi:hypothetical protein
MQHLNSSWDVVVISVAPEHRSYARDALDRSDDAAGGIGKKRMPCDWVMKCDMQCVWTV